MGPPFYLLPSNCHPANLTRGRIRMEPCYVFVYLFLHLCLVVGQDDCPLSFELSFVFALRPLRYVLPVKDFFNKNGSHGIRIRKPAPDLFLLFSTSTPFYRSAMPFREMIQCTGSLFLRPSSLHQVSRKAVTSRPEWATTLKFWKLLCTTVVCHEASEPSPIML